MGAEAIWAGIIGLVLLGLFRSGWRLRLPRIKLPIPPLSRRPPRWYRDVR